MNGNMLIWYLKECLLKSKQIIAHVGDSPKTPTTKDKTKPLGFQKMEHESKQPKVTWLGYFVMPLITRSFYFNMCHCIQNNKVIILLEMNNKCRNIKL
jgi:hypothetical protein